MLVQICLLYYIISNLLLFILMGLDKRRAAKYQRRINEKSLLIWGVAGAALGGLSGMLLFNHKIRKFRFWLVYFLALFAHLYLWWKILL
jgi:uncharacterized membrane protein YsdA (DUF1294 family)